MGLGDDYQEIFAMHSSSGSSGNPFYWPALKADSLSVPDLIGQLLENWFDIERKKTLAIVGLSLGSWAGGEYISWALKTMALNHSYPFWVFSCGNHHDEIIRAISQMESSVDLIILFMVPSAIGHFYLKASQLKQTLPFEKLRYIVMGEPFPESIRASLQRRAGVKDNSPFMFSVYGSADTSGLGIETLTTIALRKLLYQNNALASELGIEYPIPNFFHFTARDTFVEVLDGHLCVTRWQGIPLVRYILYDRVGLYSWQGLKQAILKSAMLQPEDKPWLEILSSASDRLPDLLAVSGRADSCVILKGTNLTEYMLDAAVKCQELSGVLTGLYRAKIIYEQERQYLQFDLEIIGAIKPDRAIVDRIYHTLVQMLGKVQPEFLDDWQNVYSQWDRDPTKRILRLNLIPWPSLSQKTETSIKQRGIVKNS